MKKKKNERKKTNTGTHPAPWTHTKRNEGLQVKVSVKLPTMWGAMWVSHVLFKPQSNLQTVQTGLLSLLQLHKRS